MRFNYYPSPLSNHQRLTSAQKTRLVEAFQKRVPMFRRIPKPVTADLAAASSIREYSQGQFLCHPEDPAHVLWVLLKGRISIHRTNRKGTRVGIEIMLPGDVFGLPAILFGTYPNAILAVRDSIVAAIPKVEMLKAVGRSPELAQEILRLFGERLQFLESQLVFSREDAEKRLVATLLYLCHKFGPKLPLTRVELSEMSGTSPETTIRILQRLIQRRLIRKAPGLVLCNVGALRALMAPSEYGPVWETPNA